MKISIVTPTFNSEKTIFDCLNSILQQKFENLEHFIIDGLSSDNTINTIIETFPSYSGNIFSESDNGIYDAMNKGIDLLSGDVVGFLNSDDFYSSPNVLSQIARIFENPVVDACYGDLIYVLERSKPRNENFVSKEDFEVFRYWKSGAFSPDKFKWGWMPPHPTFFVRRRVYEKYGLFNLDLGSAADYELMLRFLYKYRIKTVYIPEILVCMRAGGVSNASLQNRINANRMDRKAWDVNGLRPYPWTLLMKPMRKIPQWWRKPPRGTFPHGPS